MNPTGTGWLVHRGHYGDRSLSWDMVRRQKEALEEIGVPFDFIDVYEAAYRMEKIMQGEMDAPKWVLFRNADMAMRHALELFGTRCINSFETASICQDKAMTATFLAEHGFPHPKTMKVPSVADISYSKNEFLDKVESVFDYPMVVKDEKGEEGRGVVLAHDRAELSDAIPNKNPDCIIQDFVDTSWGVDVRIFVVGDKIPLAVKRTNDSGDFRSNTSQGGSMELYELTEGEKALAEEIGRALPYSCISVDIMWDSEGNPIVCELNGNPNFGSFKKHIFYNAPIASTIASMISTLA